MRGPTWSSVLVYIDDIVVYAHSYADLKRRLAEVFQCLQMANLKLKWTKVQLFQHKIKVCLRLMEMDMRRILEVCGLSSDGEHPPIRRVLGSNDPPDLGAAKIEQRPLVGKHDTNPRCCHIFARVRSVSDIRSTHSARHAGGSNGGAKNVVAVRTLPSFNRRMEIT